MSYLLDNRDILPLANSAIAVSKVYPVGGADTISYQLNYSDATPGVKTFVAANVNTAGDYVTITAHGYSTGTKVALSGTNLPAGLSATTYWMVALTVNRLQFATSLANASATPPVVVDITSQGTTADATLTPALLATTGQVVKLQQSNDGVTYFDVSGLTVTITAAGNTLWLITSPPTVFHQIVVTPTTGTINLDVIVASKAIVNQ